MILPNRSRKAALLRLALRLGLFRPRQFALSGERIQCLPDEIVLDLWQRQRSRRRKRGAR